MEYGIKCAICGEYCDPEDMYHWQKILFRKGAGCPGCKGIRPNDRDELDVIDTYGSSMLDDEEPDSMLPELEDMAEGIPRPPWVRPDNEVVWKCDGCEVECAIDNETGEYVWQNGKKIHYHYGFAWEYGEWTGDYEAHPDEKLEIHGIDGKVFCPGCVVECGNCEAKIFDNGLVESDYCGDSYDPGRSFPNPKSYYARGVCVDCFEELSYDEEYEDSIKYEDEDDNRSDEEE